MDDQQRLEGMINELNMYKSQADVLNQQIEGLKVSISELTLSLETLEEVEGKGEVETFVPIGAGSFLITELKNTDEVIVSLGAGAAVKKKISEAKDNIKDQKDELEGLLSKMVEDLQKITDVIMQKSPEAEELIQKLEGVPK